MHKEITVFTFTFNSVCPPSGEHVKSNCMQRMDENIMQGTIYR